VERHYQANPTFQNIETLDFGRHAVPTVAEKISPLRTVIVDNVYPFIFNPTPKNHNHQPYPKNYLKNLKEILPHNDIGLNYMASDINQSALDYLLNLPTGGSSQ
jgi:hypothetical protein